jgi:hypothetical protein
LTAALIPRKFPAMENAFQPRHHLPTVIAIALIVYATCSVVHEGIGHGGACLLTCGTPLQISSVHFDCGGENKWVAAGGTIANLIFGFVFWILSRAVTSSTHWRYFFWLAMTINLLQGGGYFLYSGIGNIGDWATVITGWQPLWLWRVLLTAAGLVTYAFFIWFALRELQPLLPPTGAERVAVSRDLMLWPYLAGGIQSCIAGALNPVGMILVAISAAAASFGGTSGLAWMCQLYHGKGFPADQDCSGFSLIIRSNEWIIAAAVIAIAFIAMLGPGLNFKR